MAAIILFSERQFDRFLPVNQIKTYMRLISNLQAFFLVLVCYRNPG